MSDNSYTFSDFQRSHAEQLKASSVPERYWEILHVKLKEEVFDAGRVFQLLQVKDEDDDEDADPTWMVAVADGQSVKAEDNAHIYLIDHAWTYQVPFARKQLLTVQGLPQRIAALMDIAFEDGKPQEQLVDEILKKMWRFNQTYQFGGVASDDDTSLEPMWYVLDEFGARIQHSTEPSVRAVPFYYAPKQCAFSLMWPLHDMDEGDEVTRDYAEGLMEPASRRAKLTTWFVDDLTDVPAEHMQRTDDYFKRFTGSEDVPVSPPGSPSLPDCIKVYSDTAQVCNHLNHPRFQIVQNKEEANVWWLKDHFTQYSTLAKTHLNTFVNQFPNEMLVTVKDPLAVVCRRAAKPHGPKWLPVTFNLTEELAQFVSYFQSREEREEDNLWICKPWNLARGLDMHISDNLEQLVRVNEAGPKVACKYVHNPVLFRRDDLEGAMVKFDIRYIVMLSSTSPLKLYAYKVFWLRFANKPYSLEDFDDYEKHYTVMNYQSPEKLCQIHYDQFIPMFEEQNPEHKWNQVEERIFSMFREMFTAASSEGYPRGIPSSPQSRAMYAVDLLLTWDKDDKGNPTMEPVLCEVNFCPDCERACKYHPNFYNDVFSALFLGDIEGRPVQEL